MQSAEENGGKQVRRPRFFKNCRARENKNKKKKKQNPKFQHC
jgi:hypothetical protein